MNEDENSELRYESSLGPRDAPQERSMGGDRTYEIEVEMEAVFEALSDRNYEHRSAAIRETISNSVTAIQRAVEDGYLDSLSETV